MNILTITSLYPNAQQPRHGIFIESRLKHFLARHPEHNISVMAPVPYFPLAGHLSSRYRKHAEVQPVELRAGISVFHPRYLMLPGIGMYIQPYLYYRAIRKLGKDLARQGQQFDLIDAHYVYPDGVAATRLARDLKVPVTITARGSDITLLPRFRLPRRLIRRALEAADACIGVCQALTEEMRRLAPGQTNFRVLRNGVDLKLFTPLPETERSAQRRKLGLSDGLVLLCVGNLIELKGQHLVIEALEQLPAATLLLVGEGEAEVALRNQVQKARLQDRVLFMGNQSQQELAKIYACADILVLASSREGWANVLLESMACGTPVIATAVWGTPEVVQSPDAGLLIEARTAAAIAEAVRSLHASPPPQGATRAYAEKFSWDSTSDSLDRLLNSLLAPTGVNQTD
tara:strand:+ start:39706 stop:40911 length:1206 start_codon:yes stop_codon:yes gene_type:complete